MIQIYELKDPRTGLRRYVGATIQRLKVRLSNHCTDSRIVFRCGGIPSRKDKWIMELLTVGLKPEILPVENCSIENVDEVEFRFINSVPEKDSVNGRHYVSYQAMDSRRMNFRTLATP